MIKNQPKRLCQFFYSMSIKRQLYDKIGFLLILFSLIVFKSFGQGCVVNTVNPSFEMPVSGAGSNFHCDNSGLTSSNCSPANAVPGWITTATDHTIEVWQKTSGSETVASTSKIGNPGDFNAAEGNQFIELNAFEVAAVYQDFQTPYPTTFTVRFSHRGRGGGGQ